MTRKDLIFISLFGALCFALPCIGRTEFSWQDFSWQETGPEPIFFWQLRLPQFIMAMLAGSALAVSGMSFQTLFRNDLASPFTLGVSSAAAFAVTLCIFLGNIVSYKLPWEWLSQSIQSVSAFTGSLLALLFLSGLLRYRKNFQLNDALLSGVAMSFFFSSLIMTLQYISDANQIAQTMQWMIGDVKVVGYKEILAVLPFYLISMILIIRLLPQMNLLLSGHELAHTRGVDIKKVQLKIFLAVSLLTGSIVAICGPISFIGIIVPHIARKIVGHDQKKLFLYSLLIGGLFLATCDTIGRILIAQTEVPVGVISSFLGAPFFIYLILKQKAS